jgi:capsular exopolysaccharide synthesis family protein
MSRLHDDLVGSGGRGPFTPTGRIQTGMESPPDFRLQQELERLQDALDVAFKPGARRVLTFMGAVVGEGATTLAVHYAFFLAHSAEKNVLLVDGDLARSSQTLSEGLEDHPGLGEILMGRCDAGQAVLATEESRLHFLPSGQPTARHAELLHSPRLAQLLEEAGARYDTVVVDAPPVLAHPEAALLGAAADGVIFVIQARRTRREIIQKAIQGLRLAKCNILGTVLNKRVHDIPKFVYQRI